MLQTIEMLTPADLVQLLEPRDEPCVSLFMPIYGPGEQAQQNLIRLRHLSDQAREQLKELGTRPEKCARILEPAIQRARNTDLVRGGAQGLAIFAASDASYLYPTALPLEEQVFVNDRFMIRPLTAMLESDGRFFVLALSQGNARLLDCTSREQVETPLQGIETNFEEYLRQYEFEPSLQSHTSLEGGLHGHGDAGRERSSKRKLREYLRHLETAVRDKVAPTGAPLTLAGLEEIRGLFHEVNHYPGLCRHGIDGNAERMARDELREAGWKIVAPLFEKKTDDMAALQRELRRRRGGKSAVDCIEDIVRAANYRQIDTLFVARSSEHIWGVFHEDSNRVEAHKTRHPGDEDLLDFAVFHTLKFGGKVHAVMPDDLPNSIKAAAVLRN